MPHIKEEHLLELHKTIDKSNEERDEFEIGFRQERKRNRILKNERNVLMRLSVVSLLVLAAFIALYFTTPNLFIQQRYLEVNGLALVKQETETVKDDASSFETIATKNNDHTIQNDENIVLNDDKVMKAKKTYVVQIAASEVALTSIFHRGVKGLKETHEDGHFKYFLGNFETLSEAQIQRKELLKIGFEDAFVASYKNNKRLKIEEAW